MFEGWYIKTREPEETIWLVKGYEHPEDGYISVPYMVSNKRISAHDFLLYTPRKFLRYLDCVGRLVPVIPKNEVVCFFDPEKVYKRRRRELPKQIIELIDYLDPEYVGLTGSWALGIESERSDVDLLLYGNNKEIYAHLIELKEIGHIKQCNDRRFEKVSDTFDYSTYRLLSNIRILDSCYKGVAYTIRILRDICSEKCHSIYTAQKAFKGEIEIFDNEEKYLTPSTYKVVSGGGEMELVTWHTRFSELPLGKYSFVGTLQLDKAGGKSIISPDLGGKLEPIEIRA